MALLADKSSDVLYRQTREIHANVEYFGQTALDSTGERLLIATKRGVFAYDMTRNQLDGRFSNAKEGRLAVAPDLGRVLIASPGSVTLVALADGHQIATTTLSGRAVAVLYDADRHEFLVDRISVDRRDIFVFDRDGQQVRRLSGLSDRGPAILAPRGRLLILGGDELSVVNTETGATAAWPIPGQHRPHLLAFDPDRNRVFVGLDASVQMLDGATGARLASLSTSTLTTLGYDRAAGRLVYSWEANGDGYLTVVDTGQDLLAPVQQIQVPRFATDLQFDSRKAGFTLGIAATDAGTFRRLVFEVK